MILRMAMGIALFSIGYLLGREIGRTESVREELRRSREDSGKYGAGEFVRETKTGIDTGRGTGMS